MMQSGEDFILLVAPEGTRYRSKSWKTGFYYIAQEAGVPIVPSILDYGKRRTEFGNVISPDTPLEDIIQNLAGYYPDYGEISRALYVPEPLCEERAEIL